MKNDPNLEDKYCKISKCNFNKRNVQYMKWKFTGWASLENWEQEKKESRERGLWIWKNQWNLSSVKDTEEKESK